MACGGIREAVDRIRNDRAHPLQIEVEVSDMNQVREALEKGVDIIMLDNMKPNDIHEAVTLIDGRALVEVSGGVTLETLVEAANTGVDIISIGALRHNLYRCTDPLGKVSGHKHARGCVRAT
jgi:nicotinate-nucleotide pyrophosphorylase (carboxylating)